MPKVILQTAEDVVINIKQDENNNWQVYIECDGKEYFRVLKVTRSINQKSPPAHAMTATRNDQSTH